MFDDDEGVNGNAEGLAEAILRAVHGVGVCYAL